MFNSLQKIFRTKKHERKEGKWIVENNLEGYAWCLRCEDWVKNNSGHSNFIQIGNPNWMNKRVA
jgi:hypothetical protein